MQPPKVTSDGRIAIIGDNGRSLPNSAVKDGILLFDGGGNNLIFGSKGNDIIHAGKSDDLVYGGKGNDLIWGALGANSLIGGSGDDTIYGGVVDLLKRNQNQSLSAQMQNQPALLFGGSGNDLLFGMDKTIPSLAVMATIAPMGVKEMT